MIKNNNKGFSLIELMVVVGIIGILASVAVPNLLKFQAKAKQANAKTELSALYGLERALYVEYTQYSPHLKILGFAPDGLTETNKGLVKGCISDPTTAAIKVDANGASADWPVRYYSVGFKNYDTFEYGNQTLNNGFSSCKVTDVQSTIKDASGAYLTVKAEASATVTQAAAKVVPAFVAMAKGRIVSDEAITDYWTIDNNKVLVNTTVGY